MSKSVARDLKVLETRVRERMDELKPQLEEWGELTQVAAKLGIEVPTLDASTGTAGQKKTTRRKRASGKRTRRPRAAKKTTPAPPAPDAGGSEPAAESEAEKGLRADGQPRLRAAPKDWRPELETAIKAEPGLSAYKLAEKLGAQSASSSIARIIKGWDDDGTIERRDGGVYWTA